MKPKFIVMIAAGGLILIGGVMCLVALAGVGFRFEKLMETEVMVEKTYVVEEDFNNVDLTVGSQKVKIVKSEEDRTSFVCYESESIVFDVKVENDTLKIEQKDTGKFKFAAVIDGLEKEDYLYLPKDVYEKLNAHCSSGDIDLTGGIEFGDSTLEVGSGNINIYNTKMAAMDTHCSSGDIKVERSSATRANLHCGSGDVNVDGFTVEGECEVDVSSGNCKFQNGKMGSLDAHCGSGDIELTSVDVAENFKGKTSSGSLNFMKVIAGGDMELISSSGDIELSECDGANLKIKASSGSVSGTILTEKIFDIHVSSGDVTVPEDGTGENVGSCTINVGSGDVELKYALKQSN